MRNYILTDRERTLIKAFFETNQVSPENYNSYCQLRHQIRRNISTLTQDIAIIETFMETTRKPKCFGSDKVVWKEDYPKKCLKCDAQAECLVENCKKKVFMQ